jgi:primosomal protein N'
VPLEYRTHPEASLQSTVKGVTLIDARRDKEIPQGTATEPWSALPKNLREHIGMAAGAGGRVLVLAVRKGYAPSVICRDCGTARTDEHGNVLTFTKSGPNGHAFRTVEGKILESTDVLCEVCGSWNLLPLGVGVERVEEELRAQFPDSRVIRFEGDTVRTAASARKALEHAREPGAIIIGTEAALPWLLTLKLQPFDLGAIASADSLLALPFWRARERFVRIGFLLSSMSKQTYLGTRLPDDTAARLLQNPTDPTFFQEEASLRRALHYPPFGTLVVLQAEGTRAALTILDASIRNAVGDHAVTVLPHRALTRTELRRSFVVHLKEGAWPDKNLALHLRALSPAIRILIDPESF